MSSTLGGAFGPRRDASGTIRLATAGLPQTIAHSRPPFLWRWTSSWRSISRPAQAPRSTVASGPAGVVVIGEVAVHAVVAVAPGAPTSTVALAGQ
jgi:hypothetical protein